MGNHRENDSKKRIAKEFYIRTDMDYKQIAELSGLSANTVEKYAQTFGWQEEKDILESSQSAIIADLLEEVKQINLDIKTVEVGFKYATKEQAAIRRSILESIEKLDKKEDASLLVSIMIKFLRFASARLDAETLESLKKVQTEFLLTETTKA